jgi:hypothetical protein
LTSGLFFGEFVDDGAVVYDAKRFEFTAVGSRGTTAAVVSSPNFAGDFHLEQKFTAHSSSVWAIFLSVQWYTLKRPTSSSITA